MPEEMEHRLRRPLAMAALSCVSAKWTLYETRMGGGRGNAHARLLVGLFADDAVSERRAILDEILLCAPVR